MNLEDFVNQAQEPVLVGIDLRAFEGSQILTESLIYSYSATTPKITASWNKDNRTGGAAAGSVVRDIPSINPTHYVLGIDYSNNVVGFYYRTFGDSESASAFVSTIKDASSSNSTLGSLGMTLIKEIPRVF